MRIAAFLPVAGCFALLLSASAGAHAAVITTINWQGAGSGVGSGALWNQSANWSTPGSFNAAATDLDFSSIASNTTLSASGAGTILANNLFFGNSAATPANITLNGDGTAGDVVLTQSTANPVYIYLSRGSGQLVTMGADLTLDMGSFNSYHYFGSYAPTVTGAGKGILLLQSLVKGTASGANGIVYVSQYSGNGNTAAVILANDGNTFQAPIQAGGYLGFTSIGMVGGGASALGAPTTAALGNIGMSNGGILAYVGTGDRTTDRTIGWGGGVGIANDSSSPSTLTYTGTITDTVTGTGTGTETMHLGALAGNTLVFTGTIGDSATAGYATAVAKDTHATVTGYYDASGTARTSTNAGTVVFKGANTYTAGTTISAGSLLVANTSGSGTGTGQVTVSAGGTFGGTGIVAPTGTSNISVVGGIVSPGGVGGVAIGTLTLDGGGTSGSLLSMGTGAKFAFDLGASNASDSISFLNFAPGDLALTNTAFVFSGAQAGRFLLFQFYSDAGSTLVSSGLSASSFNLAGSTGLGSFTGSLDFSTAGDVYLNVASVPEPPPACLFGAAAALLLPRLRRRGRIC